MNGTQHKDFPSHLDVFLHYLVKLENNNCYQFEWNIACEMSEFILTPSADNEVIYGINFTEFVVRPHSEHLCIICILCLMYCTKIK